MFVEVVVSVIVLFLFINLVISWINLNLQLELSKGLFDFFENMPHPSNSLASVADQITDIQNFLAELMQVMGNPFQMLAATHGARILDRIFPAKIEKASDNFQNRRDGSILDESTSPDLWREKVEVEKELIEDVKQE